MTLPTTSPGRCVADDPVTATPPANVVSPRFALLDAVERVLEEAGVPLHVTAITDRVLRANLWSTAGRTPAATVNARLAMDVKSRGDGSRFVRTAPSTFALRSAAGPPSKSPSPTASPSTRMSFTDAAVAVLDGSPDRTPMHYRAILETALANGWVKTSGKTPEATLYVSLISEIERATKRGETPRFTRNPKGYFGLSKWSVSPIETSIQAQNRSVRAALLAALHEMDPEDFESLVKQLLIRLGFDAETTKYSGDGGIDVRGTLVVAGTIRTRRLCRSSVGGTTSEPR